MTRRTLRLRWIAVIAFVSINCGPVQRKTRTTAEVDGRYGQAHDTRYGCENGVTQRYAHVHVGGSVAIDHEHESGLTAGARLRLQRGELVSQQTVLEPPQGPDPQDRVYSLQAIGGRAGFDGARLGGAFGVSVVALDGGTPIIYPFGIFKVGDLDQVWLELIAGSDDPLHIAKLASIGVGARFEDVKVQAGMGLYGQIVPDFDTSSPALHIGSDDDGVDVGATVDVAWRPIDHVGVTGGLIVGAAHAVRIGVSWAFGE